MTWGKWYWPIWLGAVLVSFLPLEVYAVVTNPRNTLSDWVWRALHIVPGEGIGSWTAADLLTFCAYLSVFVLWLPWHFWFERFR